MASTGEVVTSSSVVGHVDSIIKLDKADPKIGESKKLADLISGIGIHKFLGVDTEMYTKLREASESKKVSSRLSVCILVRALVNSFGKESEPYLVPYLGMLLDLCGDKNLEVQQVAKEAADAVYKIVNKFSVAIITPVLLSTISDNEKRWRSKLTALEYLVHASKSSPTQICRMLPDILPVVTSSVWDTKLEVQKKSKEVMEAVTATIDNVDILPFLPHLVHSMIDPSGVPECVYKLAATTFVTEVQAPTLAIMTPLLSRALSEGKTAVQRQASIIVENMCKLVEEPASTHQFLSQLKGKLERVMESASDPELREVATRADSTLYRVSGGSSGFETPDVVAENLRKEDEQILLNIKGALKDVDCSPMNFRVLEYTTKQVAALYRTARFDIADWNQTLLDKLNPFTKDAEVSRMISEKLMLHYRDVFIHKQSKKARELEEEGIEICNCEFSVAYGGMILLNNTRLRLLKGKCYALVGPNGVGKSTLMRSIANGQLEGFPPPDVLKTVFVEHSLQAEDADVPVIDFIFNNNKRLSEDRESSLKVLADFGFKDDYLHHPVGSLSGGWKMKLELARAMMEHAHILLLDEPTNHLDVDNVKWLVDYINSSADATFLIVSHDSSFIDKVCTHVLHFENRKLRPYKGNLSVFVESHPEARSYYELESTANKFLFPEPGFLEGIKSKDRAILKMANVSFTYPTKSVPALQNITIQVSLNSRVAVIGPNGAGKSTLVKLLTGVLVPSRGEVWKHPNLRVAYVAQHAFHHVEMHLDKTPNEYVRWRYANGEDKESLVKAARQLTSEEEEIMKRPISINGEKRYLEDLVGRKKSRKSYEYEVKWANLSHESNTWHPRERLEDWGFSKMVQWYDEREASREGMYSRPLTSAAVQKHFEDVGLDPEFSTHNRIRGLSGGQKVKVVLGSAMWNNPHIVVLDEPTNYLDRDSLGALAGAIKEFGGGVVIISHNREFTTTVCPEVWKVNLGIMEVEGARKPATQEKIVMKEKEEMIDAFGNVTKVKSTAKLTRKELKQKEKRRQMKIKNGEPLSSSEEEDF